MRAGTHRAFPYWALMLGIGALTLASRVGSVATSDASVRLRGEIARGAATIATSTAKNYPYATAYRLIRASVEKNVQDRRDSDAFLVGAHLITALWITRLPKDVSWRDTALARHRDVAGWLLPRIALAPDDIAHTAARAAKLSPTQERQLVDLVRELTAKPPH